MSRLHFFAILYFCLGYVVNAMPGLFDENLDDQCGPVPACFVGYDEENCNEDDWAPFEVKYSLILP